MKMLHSACVRMAFLLTALAVALVPLLAAEQPVQKRIDKEVTVTGRMVQVRPAEQQFTLQTTQGNELELSLDARSQLRRHQHEAQLSQFREGTRVRVVYQPLNGKNVVISLRDAPVTAAEVRRELREAFESAKDYSYQQKEAYEKKLQPVLRDLDDRIDMLKQQAKRAGQDAQKWYDQAIPELQRERARVHEQLARIRAAAPGAWDEVKAGVGAAWGDLQKAFQRAHERLKEEQPPPQP